MKLRLRTSIRLVFVVFSIGFIATVLGLVLLLQFTNIKDAIAGTIYYSMSDGEWQDEIWSKTSHSGPDCSCAPKCNFNKTAEIQHNITVSSCSPFKMSGGGEIYLTGGGKLTFETDVEMNGGSYIEISSTDSIKFNGDLSVSASDIWVEGFLIVNGDVDLSGGSSVCGPGVIQTTGTVTGTTWCGVTVLPVEIIYFDAIQQNSSIKLSWETASEIDNDYFTVERSADGMYFEELLNIAGSGNSSAGLDYHTTDNNPIPGVSYYRLKQTDYNGVFEYFPIKAVKFESPLKNRNLIINSVYPNPFNSFFNLNYAILEDENIDIRIIDNLGKRVYSDEVHANQGTNNWTFKDLSGLRSGVYFVQVISNNSTCTKKVFKRGTID